MTLPSRRSFWTALAAFGGMVIGQARAAHAAPFTAGAIPGGRSRFNPKTLPPAVGYSQVSEARGRIIFIAGQVPHDSDGKLVGEDDFPKQLEQIFLNLSRAAAAVGLTAKHIIKLNYYCDARVDRSLLRNVGPIRDRFVDTAAPPASTFVFVAGLARPTWLVEVEAVLASDA